MVGSIYFTGKMCFVSEQTFIENLTTLFKLVEKNILHIFLLNIEIRNKRYHVHLINKNAF